MAITIGKYITNLREEKQMSQRELAFKSNLSPTEISRIEAGKRQQPSPTTLKGIASALGIEYSDLMKVAGYLEETHEDDMLYELVFKDENGVIVDVVRGVKEMFRRDEEWTNVAYRVSRDLAPNDRKILTEMALAFLKNRKE